MNYVDGNPDMKGVPAGQEPKAKPFPCKKGTTVIVSKITENSRKIHKKFTKNKRNFFIFLYIILFFLCYMCIIIFFWDLVFPANF